MRFSGTIETPASAVDQRGETRIRLNLQATGVFDGGGAAAVRIHDLSRTGLLVETEAPLVLGQAILVALPDTGDIVAMIIWNSGALFGCQFQTPLSNATVSAARLRNPISAGGNSVDLYDDGSAHELLPARLRRLRQERGLSRAALSVLMGVSRPSIWAWESGKTVPRRSNFATLADALGISERELVAGDGAVSPGIVADRSVTAKQVRVAVQSSKEQIAALAGVTPCKVKITIEY